MILNEDTLANPASNVTTEKDEKAENDEVASATPKSRVRSRKKLCRTRSAPRSTTRRPGSTASPSLTNDQNSPTLREGSRSNTLTEIRSNAIEDATNEIEEVDDDTDDNIEDSSKYNRENTHPRTAELELQRMPPLYYVLHQNGRGDAHLPITWSVSWTNTKTGKKT